MQQVSVTEFRQHLPEYLAKVAKGEAFQITVKGRVVARLQADEGESRQALQRIVSYRQQSQLGDVLSPVGMDWSADAGHL